jgi:hypothetical protein
VVVASALIFFCLGLVAGWFLFRRARPRVGPSWEDWRHAEPIGGRAAPLIKAASTVAAGIGVLGFGAPSELRAALLGGLIGTCVPFALEGVRRYAHARASLSG